MPIPLGSPQPCSALGCLQLSPGTVDPTTSLSLCPACPIPSTSSSHAHSCPHSISFLLPPWLCHHPIFIPSLSGPCSIRSPSVVLMLFPSHLHPVHTPFLSSLCLHPASTFTHCHPHPIPASVAILSAPPVPSPSQFLANPVPFLILSPSPFNSPVLTQRLSGFRLLLQHAGHRPQHLRAPAVPVRQAQRAVPLPAPCGGPELRPLQPQLLEPGQRAGLPALRLPPTARPDTRLQPGVMGMGTGLGVLGWIWGHTAAVPALAATCLSVHGTMLMPARLWGPDMR